MQSLGDFGGSVLLGRFPARIEQALGFAISEPLGHTDDRLGKGHLAGLAFRRGWLLAANAFNFASLGPTDFNISREYGKVSLIGSLAPGIRFIGRGKEWSGMTIKGYMQFGTSVHYLNRDSVHVRGNPMILSSEKRSGLMYGFQLGVTI